MMAVFICFIGFVLCLIQLIIFDWFTKNFTYTNKWFIYNNLEKRENSKPIKIKRYWYILYCIFMLIPIVNLFLFVIGFFMSFMTEMDYNYYYNGNNITVLKLINFKNKLKYYLNTEV